MQLWIVQHFFLHKRVPVVTTYKIHTLPRICSVQSKSVTPHVRFQTFQPLLNSRPHVYLILEICPPTMVILDHMLIWSARVSIFDFFAQFRFYQLHYRQVAMASSQLRRGLSIIVYRIFIHNICQNKSTNFQMSVFSSQVKWSLALSIFWVEIISVHYFCREQVLYNWLKYW